jgi:hypothetical protein
MFFCLQWLLDLFDNPVGYCGLYDTSPGKMLRILLFFSSCWRTLGLTETLVSEQLYHLQSKGAK